MLTTFLVLRLFILMEIELKNLKLLEANERIRENIEKARQLHSKFLPRAFPDIEGISFASYYQPAENIGGDYYNILHIGFCRRF